MKINIPQAILAGMTLVAGVLLICLTPAKEIGAGMIGAFLGWLFPGVVSKSED